MIRSMKNLNDLVFLLPEYELEGFPRNLPQEMAAEVISGWVALWHPVLICGAGRIPRWHQASRLPQKMEATLFVLPPISRDALTKDASESIQEAGGRLVPARGQWRAFQQQLLDDLPLPPERNFSEDYFSSEIIEEFAALGYCYLQVQLMTRQLRYTSNIDVALFEEQVLRATEAALQNDSEHALQLLQACFDTLGQERDHYYSNDAFLLDLTLLATTTLGPSLHRQLEDPQPTSILASADLLRLVEERSPALMERIRQRISNGSLDLVGGLAAESPTPLGPRESAVRALSRAPAAYRQLNLEPPRVFSRLSYGMQADSATLLKRFGFQGALLMAFTGGKYPIASQPKISWESHDGTRLPALATDPLDANDPNSFLDLGWSVGEALDRQHVPTLVLAHWPGSDNQFYRLLKIVAARTPALGRWCLAAHYFETTEAPYHHQRLEPDGFIFDWLADARSAGLLIRSIKQTFKLQARARSLQNMANLAWQLRELRSPIQWRRSDKGDPVSPSYTAPSLSDWHPEMDQLLTEVDGLVDANEDTLAWYRRLQAIADRISKECLESLRGHLVSKQGDLTGRLIFNPRSNPVRTGVRSEPQDGFETASSWHYATGLVGPNRLTCIDLPSMGFVAGASQLSDQSSVEKILLADSAGMLRNEFVEAQIDMKRGHLRSMHIPSVRGNRFSALVAYRGKAGKDAVYSEMIAKDVSMLTCSNFFGLIRSKGILQLSGKTVGKFEIDFEIQRGSRMVVAIVSLSDLQYVHSHSNPWLNCFMLRWAWPTEAAILRTFPDGRRSTWPGGQAVSAELIEIDEVNYKTHVLTGGLAFHRRHDMRFAETVLAVEGQTHVRHRIGFAVDLPHPLAAARQFIDKPYELDICNLQQSNSGWLLNVDSPNISIDLESPLLDEQRRTVGLRVIVSELAGQSTSVRVRLFRDVAESHRVDYTGERLTRLPHSEDQVTIAMRANEQALVDVLWKPAE
jgi:alpha-mannosidase